MSEQTQRFDATISRIFSEHELFRMEHGVMPKNALLRIFCAAEKGAPATKPINYGAYIIAARA